jgi:alpha-L-arabinofuranosidase
MMTARTILFIACLMTAALPVSWCAGAEEPVAALTVQVDKPGHEISPQLWGLFFEEINYAGDGGLYAEMVRNRSFEEAGNTSYWQQVTTGTASGAMTADTSLPLNECNPTSLALVRSSTGTGSVGVANSGFWGMNFQADEVYDLSLYARRSDRFAGALTVRLENADGSRVYALGTVNGLTTDWQRFSLALTPNATDVAGRLTLLISQVGVVWLDVVSLFPRQTFNGRPNGLRPDLAGKLADLEPSFMRFPGGCYIEGDYLVNAFRWKNSIGDIAGRPGHWNAVWNYFSSDGLGYHEYLQLCEDLGAEPLFVINCGMAHKETQPLDQMAPYVQDALDAIEYANGPTDSPWGSLRAANGHPASFNLRYMEIGNENGGSAYQQRYALFYDAIKACYPEILLVADEPTSLRPADLVDEHYYSSPDFFIANASKYDSYSRTGPKVYVGEYAVTSGCGNGNLAGALGEAAFMTGMERNSDIVVMASYAPLFANLNNKSWSPDLIYFDSSRVYGTPSYYVQRLFSENRGDVVLPVEVSGPAISGVARHGAVGLGTWSTRASYANVVVTRGQQTLYQSDFASGAAGWRVYQGAWNASGGVYQQTANSTDCRSTTGDTSWSDYTITLKARKDGGNEGFLIIFNWLDDQNWTWWNIGGWGNTLHAIEDCKGGIKSDVGARVAGQVQTGRWYDIRIELQGDHIKCYLDGQLVHDVDYPESKPLLASASRVQDTGELILKVVNVSASDLPTDVTLNGVTSVQDPAAEIVLTSPKATDENSFAEPTRVAPVTTAIDVGQPAFQHIFPANSLTVLRLNAE